MSASALLKHIPYYPTSDDPQLSYKIAQLEEFDELKLGPFESIPKRAGEPLFSQEIQRRHFSKYTKDDSSLIVHTMGTGKSCVADFIIENLKSPFKRPAIVIVSNKDLVLSFRQEIVTRCTSGVYDVDVEVTPGMTQEEIKKKRRKKIKIALASTYEIGTRTSILEPLKDKTPEEIKAKYSNREIIIDEGHHYTTKSSDEEIPKHYDNLHKLTHNIENSRVFVLTGTPVWDKAEEVAPIMNIILPLDKQLPIESKFRKRFIKDGKVINDKELLDAFRGRVSFLRAMEDVIARNEMGVSAPWFEHLKVYPVVMSDFQQQVYDELAASQASKKAAKGTERSPSGNEGYESWTDDELNTLVAEENLVKRGKIKAGEYTGAMLLKHLPSNATKKQEEAYKKARAALIVILRRLLMPSGLKRELLDAAAFVYPVMDGEEPTAEGTFGTEGFKANVVLEDKQKIKGFKASYKFKNKNTLQYIRDHLYECSAKLAFIADYAKTHRNEVIFVYDEYVTGGAGIINYSLVMDTLLNDEGNKAFHWIRNPKTLRSNANNQTRFITISSDPTTTNTSYDIADMIETVSSPENANGELCQIIFGSGKIAEGLTIKNVRTFIGNVPHWNESKLDQAQYRAYRVGALANIPNPKDRYLNIILLASVKKGKRKSEYVYPEDEKISPEETVDIDVYKLAEGKDVVNAQIYRLMKMGSWDCVLNYERNVLKQDKDGSRACNYQECNYVCDGYPEKMINKTSKVWKYNTKPILTHNYTSIYLKDNINATVDKIFNLTQKDPSISLSAVLDKLGCQGYKDVLTVASKTRCWIVGIVYALTELFRGHFILRLPEVIELIALEQDKEEALLMILNRIISMRLSLINKYGFKSYLDEEHGVFFLKESPNDKGVLSSFYSQFPMVCDHNSLETLQEVVQLEKAKSILEKDCKDFSTLTYRSKIVIFEEAAIHHPEFANKIFPNQLKHTDEGLAFHQLYVIEPKGLEYNKLAKSLNITGARRILENGKWRYATPLEEQSLITVLGKEKEEEKTSLEGVDEVMAEKIGYIGIVSDGKFLIKKLQKQHKGKNVVSWNKEELYELIWLFDAFPPPSTEEKRSKQELIGILTSQKSYIGLYGNNMKNLEAMSLDKIRSIIGLTALSSGKLGEIIKAWLYKHNLVKEVK